MFTNFKTSFLIFSASLLIFASCRKEFDNPPVDEIPEGGVWTIAQVIDSIDAGARSIDSNYSVYGVVTMDEATGNIYKNVYIEDQTGAINVRLQSGGGLFEGDSIRINLKGTYINEFNEAYQIDSVDVDKNVVKQATNVVVQPDLVTIDQIDPSLEAQLVKIENVEFVGQAIGTTYADAQNQQSQNKMLTDCNGNTIIVRTSGFSDFADQEVKEGSGTFIGIVSQFGSDMQLFIRRPSELDMDDARCTGGPALLSKGFEDQSLTSGGWFTQVVTGNTDWETNDQGTGQDGSFYCQISNFDGSSNTASEAWFISPSVDLSGTSSPVLEFINAYNFNGPDLEVLISTDYPGSGNPNGATWSNLSPNLSTGSFSWVNSSELDLSSYTGQNIRIAFKYTGTNSDGSTWEIDQIEIRDN